MKDARSLHASALLLVLWALLTLSAAVFAWAAWIQNGIALHAEANRAVEAQAMAHSGIAVALHPRVTIQTQLPEETLAPGQSYRVQMISEGGKLNINWLLRGEEPAKLMILKKWLERRKLDFKQREALVDCLLDYTDADGLQRLNGRETDDKYRPANRELESVHEIRKIPGAAPLTSQPGWDDDLTIFSHGPIDLNAASIETLRLLPGIAEKRLQQFVQYRQGRDGLDGTVDDPTFKNLDEIRQFLGLTAAQFEEIKGLVMYKDPTLHITSVGRSANVTRQVEVVTRKTTGQFLILSWKE
jgi:type II secretory pathway component PulK